eukprot:gene12538-12671_t
MAGLGWAGLGWAGLGWAGLGWAGLGWAGLGWAGYPDEMNLRLSSIAQRMTMALQLIPIQKAKVMDKRLMDLQSLQREIYTATFAAARAAEQQSAQLKRLMDQSKVDSTKTHQMLEQKQHKGTGDLRRYAELADLRAELEVAHKAKNMLEEQYIAQIIALLDDPVILVDSGQTYERAAIEEWLGRGNPKDPITAGSGRVAPRTYSTSSTSSAGERSAGGFLGSFGRRKKSVDGDAASSVLDDTASVSSDGSCSTSSSRKSRGVMNMLKSISYTMKYDDEKC